MVTTAASEEKYLLMELLFVMLQDLYYKQNRQLFYPLLTISPKITEHLYKIIF